MLFSWSEQFGKLSLLRKQTKSLTLRWSHSKMWLILRRKGEISHPDISVWERWARQLCMFMAGWGSTGSLCASALFGELFGKDHNIYRPSGEWLTLTCGYITTNTLCPLCWQTRSAHTTLTCSWKLPIFCMQKFFPPEILFLGSHNMQPFETCPFHLAKYMKGFLAVH